MHWLRRGLLGSWRWQGLLLNLLSLLLLRPLLRQLLSLLLCQLLRLGPARLLLLRGLAGSGLARLLRLASRLHTAGTLLSIVLRRALGCGALRML